MILSRDQITWHNLVTCRFAANPKKMVHRNTKNVYASIKSAPGPKKVKNVRLQQMKTPTLERHLVDIIQVVYQVICLIFQGWTDSDQSWEKYHWRIMEILMWISICVNESWWVMVMTDGSWVIGETHQSAVKKQSAACWKITSRKIVDFSVEVVNIIADDKTSFNCK